ncbi:unnamed protein product, partial [Ectocarpus sp. 13 AM-2016]
IGEITRGCRRDVVPVLERVKRGRWLNLVYLQVFDVIPFEHGGLFIVEWPTPLGKFDTLRCETSRGSPCFSDYTMVINRLAFLAGEERANQNAHQPRPEIINRCDNYRAVNLESVSE